MIPRWDALVVGLLTHRGLVSAALIAVALAGAVASALLKRAEARACAFSNLTGEDE